MIQRGGQVVLHMLPNVQQKTIKPFIEAAVTKGSLLYTDEYDIYDRLPVWGYQHQSVCHSKGEYARDADGDGFHEIHVNTMEGFWSLLRSWLRPHRGGHAEFGTPARSKPAGHHASNRHPVTLETGTGSRCNPAPSPKGFWALASAGLS